MQTQPAVPAAVSEDELPSGLHQEKYPSENLAAQHELGRPQLAEHYAYQEIINWAKDQCRKNPGAFSFLDAGCRYGDNLRAFRKQLAQPGHFLGVDSRDEAVKRGLVYYRIRDNDDAAAASQSFALGDLSHLKQIEVWQDEKTGFSQTRQLADNEFDLVYLESMLQLTGYGLHAYGIKKAAAQQVLNEMFRVCKPGAKIFGRVICFAYSLAPEERLDILRSEKDWRFIPGIAEFADMLKDAGFKDIDASSSPYPPAAAYIDPGKKNLVQLSFVASYSYKP